MIEIRTYQNKQGSYPFEEWLNGVRDKRAVARIRTRITRLTMGNEGDWKPVGEGVRELRISEGKGYRVYYAWDGMKIVLLLCGGDKRSQVSDIDNAKVYWSEYNA
ncbi:MAG: type II toxin-antitoxin system RelE/ParE family toxin [Sedimenticola sp.]